MVELLVHTPAIGACRRLRALVFIGYHPHDLATHLGMAVDVVNALLEGSRLGIESETHDDIVRLFAELWRRPVTGAAAAPGRDLARSRGWCGPLAWDDLDDPDEEPNLSGRERRAEGDTSDTGPLIDEVAVAIALSGHPVTLTRHERHVAVTALHAQRWGDALIARTLRVSDRTILRDRRFLGLTAHPQSEIRKAAAL